MHSKTNIIRYLKSLAGIAATAGLVFALPACDVEKTDEGEMPEVDVQGGDLPNYDVDTPDVDVSTEEKEITVPDVDVDVKDDKVTIPVPDVDVTPADADEPDADVDADVDVDPDADGAEEPQ